MTLVEAGPTPMKQWEILATGFGLAAVLGNVLRFIWPGESLEGRFVFGDFDPTTGQYGRVPMTEDALSYVVTPPPRVVEIVVTILAIVVLMLVAKRAFARLRNSNGDFFDLGQLVAAIAGVIAGVSWHAATYATHDANIGGGMGLVLGFPMAGVLLVVAVVLTRGKNRPSTRRS